MIRNILNARFAANLDYARRLVDGLTEDQANVIPAEGMNSPRWIVGHLAQTADQVTLGWMLGEPRTIESWDEWFDAGTSSADLTAEQPTLAQALVELECLHGKVSEAVAASPPDRFERSIRAEAPEVFRERFTTLGNALAHTMLVHEMQHLGQLSAWRRLRGLSAV